MTLSSTPCDGSVFVWISQIWLYLIIKSVVPNASAGPCFSYSFYSFFVVKLWIVGERMCLWMHSFFFKMLILIDNEHRKIIHSQKISNVKNFECILCLPYLNNFSISIYDLAILLCPTYINKNFTCAKFSMYLMSTLSQQF